MIGSGDWPQAFMNFFLFLYLLSTPYERGKMAGRVVARVVGVVAVIGVLNWGGFYR